MKKKKLMKKWKMKIMKEMKCEYENDEKMIMINRWKIMK